MQLRIVLAAFLLGVVPVASGAERISLERSIRDEVSRFPRTMGVFARNLVTGERVAVNESLRFPTARFLQALTDRPGHHSRFSISHTDPSNRTILVESNRL